jgi:cytochrome c-type biogenesis protein CcmH
VIKLLGSRIAWAVLLAAAVVLLAIGSVNPPSSSAAARISRLDSIIKCPGCEDLSIAQSDAPGSVTLRNEVATWVRKGWSDQRIEQVVVDRYGEAGLLLPTASGGAGLLYIVPLAVIGLAAVLLGWHLWRRPARPNMQPREVGQ